ncbi:MAG: hypothetical protein H6597_02885 [Flavobacteriales bacterium]|nr:hypothetical protein [Flavobacteriales bacterium]
MLRKSWSLLLLSVLLACGTMDRTRPRSAEGGKRYGGVFNANESEQIRSIFPLSLSQASAHRIAAQIYQGLVRLDQRTLSVKPCLAEAWEVDPTAMVYTFHLRQDVKFHADPVFKDADDRRLNAEDVLYCFARICTASPDNQMFWRFQDLRKARTRTTRRPREGPTRLVGEAAWTIDSTYDPHPPGAFGTGLPQVLAHQG